jgi:hypothetical protein
MAEGGFLVKFDGKKAVRCYAISFDYDERQYTVNQTDTRPLPLVKKITIEVEEE